MNIITGDDTSFIDYYNASSLSLSHRRGLVLHLLYTLETNDYDLSVGQLFLL